MKYLILILFLLLPVTAQGADRWSQKDVGLEVLYTTVHILDWHQTLRIATDDAYTELNPILGETPSRVEVNRYFTSTLVAHVLITHYLPRKYRTLWQGVSIGFEFGVVRHNVNMGIKISF